MNLRKMIIILFIIYVVILVFVNINKNNKELIDISEKQVSTQTKLVEILDDGTKVNTSNKLFEMKKVGNLEITDSQLTNKDGKTTLLANAKNVGNETIQMIELQIIMLDEQGNEIKTLNGILGTIKPGETAQLNVSAQTDYSNAYNYIVKIK